MRLTAGPDRDVGSPTLIALGIVFFGWQMMTA